MTDSRSTDSSVIPPPLFGEPYLLTPGPLTTARSTKEAMLQDRGSWDADFRSITAEVRSSLLDIAGVDGSYDCVPLQGSGTFCVEAMLGSFAPPHARTLVLSNGAYGARITRILDILHRDSVVLDKGDFLPPRGEEVAAILDSDTTITHVAVVHCETSSGILNPVAEIAAAVHERGRDLLVDAMSSFGAIEVPADEWRYEALVSSANKCIEGVPGFGFVIAKTEALERAKGTSHSLSLDVEDQWEVMRRTGQWRFTPPTHVVAALDEALRLHREEGGRSARLMRYEANRDTLVEGMRALGFETLLPDEWLSPIIVTFLSPDDPAFIFAEFYEAMKEGGFIIYPGKLTEVDSFRIGCIGQIDAPLMARVVATVAEVLSRMGVRTAAPSKDDLAQRRRLHG